MNINFDKPIHVYFIGIGGISMSGIASILLSKGFKISGSDAKASSLTEDLIAEGATVYYGQEESHITPDVDLVVYTAAIKENNPEFIHMKELGLPYMTRAEFLGQLMKNYQIPVAISGTHGKTTTTTMISDIMMEAELDPTITVGGIVQSINSSIRVGGPEFFVFEACEYTNSFLSFFPKASVILNIEEDHLDFFKDINDIRNSFGKFAGLLPDDGLLVINGEIDNYKEITSQTSCRYVTFGFSPVFDYYATDIRFDSNGLPTFTCHVKKSGGEFDVTLKVPGKHNVANALAAIALCRELNISNGAVKRALAKCEGSKRRFEFKGVVNGVTIIDDYAHHPTEIRATLQAALNRPHKKLWCVFQPHTYTRIKALLPDFVSALSLCDTVILTDVYAAREQDIYGVNSNNLFDALVEAGTSCVHLHNFNGIVAYIKSNCTSGDLLITLGAGDVVNIANTLISQ